MAKKAAKKRAGRPSLDASPQQILRNGHVAARLREELAKRHWKAPDLSAAVGGARDGVVAYRWLSGKGAPSPKLAEKLARLFGGTAADFSPRDPGAVATPHAELLTLGAAPTPAPAKRVHRPAAEVFAFTVNEHGMARLRLDVSLPLAKIRPLFTQLLQIGLLPEGGQDDAKQEEEHEQ